MSDKVFGFTLAEVLITLGVIGVVAAMTLPTVIRNYQKQQTVIKLKRAYNTMSNAIQMSKNVNGEVADWDIKFDDKLQDASDFADKYLIPYMKVVKACKTNQSGDCIHRSKYIDGTSTGGASTTMTSFYTNDGILYILGNGTTGQGTISTNYNVIIDINGNKAPNTYGKDIFIFQLHLNSGTLKANFAASGKERIDEYCKNYGFSCAAKIINAGWKIENDYPW